MGKAVPEFGQIESVSVMFGHRANALPHPHCFQSRKKNPEGGLLAANRSPYKESPRDGELMEKKNKQTNTTC